MILPIIGPHIIKCNRPLHTTYKIAFLYSITLTFISRITSMFKFNTLPNQSLSANYLYQNLSKIAQTNLQITYTQKPPFHTIPVVVPSGINFQPINAEIPTKSYVYKSKITFLPII